MTPDELRTCLIVANRFYRQPIPFLYDFPEEGLKMLYDFAFWCCHRVEAA